MLFKHNLFIFDVQNSTMKKFLKTLGIVLIVLIAGAAIAWFFFLKPTPPPISAEDRARLQVMPLPASLEFSNGSLLITENFGINFEAEPNLKIEKAIERFYKELVLKTGLSLTNRSGLGLHIKNPKVDAIFPQMGENESYELKITNSNILLNASSDTGILYGLETLIQLAEFKEGQWHFPEVDIKDHPRYPWRGLMIDVSRHWIPKDVVLRNLDAMAKLKMNVFHWHLSDYQGFRVESKKFPKLHELGSQGNYYSQEDLKEVINYASDRGIRIIPEFDVPGHTTSWLAGYPKLGSAPGPYSPDTIALGVFRPVMDPTNPDLYAFLDEFVAEMVTIFPDEYFHIGGDEVMAKDWEDNEDIQNYMKANNIGDSHELQAYFNIRLQKIIAKHNRIMLGWDEIIHPDLPVEGIAVQAWRTHKSLWESARKGNKAILSKGLYLDHKKSALAYYKVDPEVIKGAVQIEIDSVNWTSYKSEIYFGDSSFEGNIYMFGKDDNIQIIMNFMEDATSISEVEKKGNKINFTNQIDVGKMNVSLEIKGDSLVGLSSIGLFDLELRGIKTGGSDLPDGEPLPKFDNIEPLTELESENILGGEACMWTEMVDSVTLESRIWPKAAAIAEKLWSPQELTEDGEDMYRRLMVMNKELAAIGLRHRMNQEIILKSMVAAKDFQSLNFLVDYLHEGAFVNRLSLYQPTLYTSTELNGIVDAASAESYPAYTFNKNVDQWLDSRDKVLEGSIESLLQKWIENHDKLRPLFDSNQKVKMIRAHSENLSILASMALKITDGKELSENDELSMNELLQSAHKEHGGTVLAVVPGLEKLIRSAQ